MKKNILILVVVFGVVLVATNPSEQNHTNKVKSVFNETLENDIAIDTSEYSGARELGESFGKLIAQNAIQNNVSRDNYIIFSTTKYLDKTIGYGFLGNVYLSEEFYDKIESKEPELTPVLEEMNNQK
jgi:hypothetical protein